MTLGILGMINWYAGAVVALSSIAGINIGIYLVNKIQLSHYKQVLVTFYSIIFALTAYKIIVG
jgi:uncharacterized membrane protein YfcA